MTLPNSILQNELDNLKARYNLAIAKISNPMDERETLQVSREIVILGDQIKAKEREIRFIWEMMLDGARYLSVAFDTENDPYAMMTKLQHFGKFPIEQYERVNNIVRTQCQERFPDAEEFDEDMYGGLILSIRRMEHSTSIMSAQVMVLDGDDTVNTVYLSHVRG